MSTFLLTRNQYASGPIAHAMGIYLAATQAHIDVKRLLSRVGLSISDTSAHAALRSMTQSSLSSLRETISNAHRRGEELYCLVIDNIQEYYRTVRNFAPLSILQMFRVHEDNLIVVAFPDLLG
jgi:hypothetical protein